MPWACSRFPRLRRVTSLTIEIRASFNDGPVTIEPSGLLDPRLRFAYLERDSDADRPPLGPVKDLIDVPSW